MVDVVKATIAHAVHVAEHMRQSDRLELEASGHAPLGSLVEGIQASDFCNTLLVDGRPSMIYGVVRLSEEISSPWALGTDDINLMKKSFMEFCRGEIRRVLTLYPSLYNEVDERNTSAIKWLKWLGFTVLPAVASPHRAVPFRPFVLRAEPCAYQ